MDTALDLKTTPLIDEHRRRNAKLAPFGGWLMPIQYDGIISEHIWTRNSASIFDICHMGEFIVRGTLADTMLDRVVTVDCARMADGQCRYGFLLNEDGGVNDDIVVYKIHDDEWMIVVNAATIKGDEAHLRKFLKKGCLENASMRMAKLDLQGPLSLNILREFVGVDLPLGYYTFGKYTVLGQACIISRTGYTGELGYEIYIPADKAQVFWGEILRDKRVRPAGLGARDTLRLEMCYPLYGQDVDSKITPLEAGAVRYISFGKDFLGKNALITCMAQGVRKMLVSFMTDSRRAPRHNYKILRGGKEIGVVTSGSFAPSIGCGIGMGYVDAGNTDIGTDIIIREGTVELKAVIVERPFYKKGTARQRVVPRS